MLAQGGSQNRHLHHSKPLSICTGVHTAAGPHGPGLVGTLLLPAARLWSCVRVPTTRLGHAVMCRNVGWLLVRTRQQTRDLLFSKSKQLESFSKLGSVC